MTEQKRIATCLAPNLFNCSSYAYEVFMNQAQRIIDGEKPPKIFKQVYIRRQYRNLGGIELLERDI